jgi:uncharacterized protein
MGQRIFIEAIRTIRPGEELAYDYRIQRDADDPADIDIVFRCLCGAKNCRGSMLVARPKKRAQPRLIKSATQRAKKRAQQPKRRKRPR